MDTNVIGAGIRVRQTCGARLGSRDLLEFERLAGHQIEDRFVAGHAALSNGIEKRRGAGRRRRDVVENLERRRLWRKKRVLRVLVLLRLSLRRGRRGQRDRQHDDRRPPPGCGFLVNVIGAL